jgi:hypothetical protein
VISSPMPVIACDSDLWSDAKTPFGECGGVIDTESGKVTRLMIGPQDKKRTDVNFCMKCTRWWNLPWKSCDSNLPACWSFSLRTRMLSFCRTHKQAALPRKAALLMGVTLLSVALAAPESVAIDPQAFVKLMRPHKGRKKTIRRSPSCRQDVSVTQVN